MRLIVLIRFVNCILSVSYPWFFFLRLELWKREEAPGQAAAADPDLFVVGKLRSLHRERQVVAGAAFVVGFYFALGKRVFTISPYFDNAQDTDRS